jgi:hypothetical protein
LRTLNEAVDDLVEYDSEEQSTADWPAEMNTLVADMDGDRSGVRLKPPIAKVKVL